MSYVILGRAIKNEHLAIGTILSTVGIAVASMSGGKKEAQVPLEQAKNSVKFESSSKEETELMDSINKYIAEAEKESAH